MNEKLSQLSRQIYQVLSPFGFEGSIKIEENCLILNGTGITVMDTPDGLIVFNSFGNKLHELGWKGNKLFLLNDVIRAYATYAECKAISILQEMEKNLEQG